MMRFRIALVIAVLCGGAVSARQLPPPIDTAKVGPPVGARVPPIRGSDQFGTPRTLDTISGPKGAMVVFFRSADW